AAAKLADEGFGSPLYESDGIKVERMPDGSVVLTRAGRKKMLETHTVKKIGNVGVQLSKGAGRFKLIKGEIERLKEPLLELLFHSNYAVPYNPMSRNVEPMKKERKAKTKAKEDTRKKADLSANPSPPFTPCGVKAMRKPDGSLLLTTGEGPEAWSRIIDPKTLHKIEKSGVSVPGPKGERIWVQGNPLKLNETDLEALFNSALAETVEETLIETKPAKQRRRKKGADATV
ncbi:MAG: hypothetical protein AB1489_37225, partial [Acidobacteriota bacterium]